MRPRLALAAAVLTTVAVVATVSSGLKGRPGQPVSAPIDHIILVTVDALRADRLGCYGYSRAPTSPAIDAFAAAAVLFEHAYAQAPWTVPSMASLMAGRYGLASGAYTNAGDLTAPSPTLAERLKARGYRTAFFDTNPMLWRPGIKRGFDTSAPAQLGQKIPYTSVEPMIMAWLDRHAHERFFLWIHDMDTHDPPTQGNSYLRQENWDPYDAEVRWVDEAMARLFAKLEQLGVRDQVLFIFTADHGEAFNEHSLHGHQDVIYDEVLQVPLIVQYPQILPARITAPVQVLDLNSTIAELAGLKAADGSGESLLPLLDGSTRDRHHPSAFSSRYYFDQDVIDPSNGKRLAVRGQHHLAVHDAKWALIAKVMATSSDPRTTPDWDLDASSSQYELYDLALDPHQEHNVIGSQTKAAAALRRTLADWQRSAKVKTADIRSVGDPATRESMRALGYGPR